MVGLTRSVRLLAAAGTTTLIAVGLAAGPVATATPSATSVTILLKAPHQHRLNRLALARGLTHAQRITALRPLLPSATAHRHVDASLTGRGFTITHETAWTIDATGPASTAAATFGADSASESELSVPDAISAVTAAVFPTTTAPAIFAPRDLCSVQCHNGTDFRDAYSAPNQPLHNGHDTNGPLTVATLQFPLDGGWNPSDLTKYAARIGLPDPVARGQYQQIPVDGAKVPRATKKEQGADEEVDLDQETILSTAPQANQRAYFDTSATKAAYTDALSQVLADVTQGPGAIDGGDPKIAALSTSWGACESEFSDQFAFPQDTVRSVGNVLKSLTAAGVTIFAASGDDGIYDCGDAPESTKIAVDYPASAPQVIGVGGTRLKPDGKGTPNNGHNWREASWSCTSDDTCQGQKTVDTGGSGGGVSKLFAMPTYQTAGIGTQHFTTSTGKKGDFGSMTHRLVPDIASDGDPATGFATLTSDPADVPSCALGPQPPCKAKSFAIGGTSLSAPASAAMFVDMLSRYGAKGGVGDIHDALYAAYAAHDGAFRDITSGRNGRQKNVDNHSKGKSAHEFPVNAQKGYDTVTGLGAPLWPAIGGYIVAPTPPRRTG